jgi:hypothetical protein
MTSESTREFEALCAIAQHVGRPGTPTDAVVCMLVFAVKPGSRSPGLDRAPERAHQDRAPHQLAITEPATLRAKLAVIREHYNTIRLIAVRRTNLLLAPDLEADLGDAEQYLLT